VVTGTPVPVESQAAPATTTPPATTPPVTGSGDAPPAKPAE